MRHIIAKHKAVWYRNFTHSVIVGLVLLACALVINYFASLYANERVSGPVTDLLLNNLPVFDVDEYILYGAAALIGFAIGLLVYEPKRLPFVLKAAALFIIIRSAFITLTHIGPFPNQEPAQVNQLLQALTLNYSADLFFSGHTGLPFLLGLIYWDNFKLRIFFLISSLIFGAMVILGHVHYSIDVFGAFFITYSIFHIVQKLFPDDWKLALS